MDQNIWEFNRDNILKMMGHFGALDQREFIPLTPYSSYYSTLQDLLHIADTKLIELESNKQVV